MKQIIFTSVILLILSQHLFAQLVNYSDKKSVKILGENTTLTITGISTNPTQTKQVLGIEAVAGTILPPVIDYMAAAIEDHAAKEALKYQGSYTCSASDDGFYAGLEEVLLPKVSIRRIVKTLKGDDVTAVEIDLMPELSADKTAFRYMTKDHFIYNYSIVKTKGRYDYINLDLIIKFKSLSVQKEEYKLADLRTTTIHVPLIHVGKTTQLPEPIFSGWIPLPPRSNVKVTLDSVLTRKAESTTKLINSNKKESVRTETVNTSYKTTDFKRIQSRTGLYEIEITATESNPYKIRAENRKSFVEHTSEPASDAAKAGVEVLTTEEGD